MRRAPLALVALTLLAPLLLVAEPAAAAASTTKTSSCQDGGGYAWKVKAVWGSVYSDHGVQRVSAKAVRLTTKAKVARVSYTVTVVDGDGVVVQRVDRQDRKFSFKKGKRYLSTNPANPPSSPARTTIVVTVGDSSDDKPGCTLTFAQPGKPAPGNPAPVTSPSAPAGSWPSSPPAKVCGNAALLSGPGSAPSGAVTVPSGDNASVDFSRPRTTYWFAPGVHTLGGGQYDQIVPGDGATFVGAPGAVLDGQQKNAYAFTQHARDVTITYLTIQNFVAPMNEGTVNHDSGEGWTVSHSTITRNGGAGVFLGSRNTVAYSCLAKNSQYGFQGYSADGPSGLVLDHNEIVGNNTGNWEARVEGCGCTGGGKFWDAQDVRVTDNYVHDNASVGLWADTNNNNFLFQGNWISDNAGQAIFWEISYNAAIRDNVIRHNLTLDGPQRIASGDSFPDAAIYLSESGGDPRLPYDLVGSATIDVAGNLVDDNYNGVTLWENADRFCGSPANTSSGYCTQVDTKVARLATCTKAHIAQEPYYSACRWKTQNVHVHHNTFTIDRAHLGDCPARLCGRNAVFSNWGSYPDWSPYKGPGVSQQITFHQRNVFSDNTYVGGWSFVALDTSTLLSPAVWRAAPYGQDARSTFR